MTLIRVNAIAVKGNEEADFGDETGTPGFYIVKDTLCKYLGEENIWVSWDYNDFLFVIEDKFDDESYDNSYDYRKIIIPYILYYLTEKPIKKDKDIKDWITYVAAYGFKQFLSFLDINHPESNDYFKRPNMNSSKNKKKVFKEILNDMIYKIGDFHRCIPEILDSKYLSLLKSIIGVQYETPRL